MERYITLSFAILFISILYGCSWTYNNISVLNISDNKVNIILINEDGKFSRKIISPYRKYNFIIQSKKSLVHDYTGEVYTHIYIYEDEIQYLSSDDLKKYVQENKAISEYSLKELYFNEQNYNKNNKKYGEYIIKNNRIEIIPYDQYQRYKEGRGSSLGGATP